MSGLFKTNNHEKDIHHIIYNCSSHHVARIYRHANGTTGAPPGGTGGGGPIADPAGVPIDGGISALIAGGAAMLGRKYYKNKKAKEAKAE